MLKTVRLLFIAVFAASALAASAAAKRPNILFMLTDDQRWDALGIAGNPHLKTPNMDRLGKETRSMSSFDSPTDRPPIA